MGTIYNIIFFIILRIINVCKTINTAEHQSAHFYIVTPQSNFLPKIPAKSSNTLLLVNNLFTKDKATSWLDNIKLVRS